MEKSSWWQNLGGRWEAEEHPRALGQRGPAADGSEAGQSLVWSLAAHLKP